MCWYRPCYICVEGMPMPRRLRILLVAQNNSLAHLLATWLRSASFEQIVVGKFEAAKLQLDMEPDLLVTELKLSEHNGLHLALRARSKAIPAIVIGHPDAVLARDAQELGATYLHTSELHRDQFLAVVDKLTASHVNVRTRNHIAWLDESSTPLPETERSPTPLSGILGLPPLLH